MILVSPPRLKKPIVFDIYPQFWEALKVITPPPKPLLRGYFHQGAILVALFACGSLLLQCRERRSEFAILIYSLSLVGLFVISALYHRVNWRPTLRMWMRRLDHAAIFILIAGTATPVCLLALPPQIGNRFLTVIWVAASLGILQSLFWVHAPKWCSALLYVGVGLLVVPYLSALRIGLSDRSLIYLIVGGLTYILGALIYALKSPNPWPRIFGYHEIFHLLVIGGAGFHFLVIRGLLVK